jgi:hypothetical protein
MDELALAGREAVVRDPRAVRIFAKTIYRELRQSGLDEEGVMALAGELLSLLAADVSDRRRGQDSTRSEPAAHGATPVLPKSNAASWPPAGAGADGAR